VIEVSRQDNALERAVRYFAGDKVVAKDFATAANLQQKKGIKDVISEDGTEFKQGMISGGQHSNIFNISLGTTSLDRQIVKLVDSI